MEAHMPRSVSILAIAWLLTTSELAYGQEAATPRKEFAVSGVLLVPDGDWIRPRQARGEQEFFEVGVRYLKGGGVRLRPGRVEPRTHAFMVYVGWGFRPRSSRGPA
jgi:hypothetical protein